MRRLGSGYLYGRDADARAAPPARENGKTYREDGANPHSAPRIQRSIPSRREAGLGLRQVGRGPHGRA